MSTRVAPFGGTILVDPVQIFAAPSRTLSEATGVAGAGSASIFLPLPVGTEGLQFFVQAVVIDPNTPGGLSMSRGVGIAVGR